MAPEINLEFQAFQSLADLIDRAEKCRLLFTQAGIALPEPLQRILKIGMTNGNAGEKSVASPVIPPPEMHSKPPEAGPDWICVRAKDAMPTSLVLAILRMKKGPVRSKDVLAGVTSISPDVSNGSVSNIGARLLKRGIIKRGKEGWYLLVEANGGVLHNGWLWGPPSIFDPHDLAAHRREAILYILKCHSTGLQMVQLVDRLHNCRPWLHAPVSKDLVTADLEVLFDQGKIKRRGNTRNWEIVSKDKKNEEKKQG